MIACRAWLIFLLCGLLVSTGVAATTPQDIFFQLYFTLTEAERLEKQGDINAAYQRYVEVGQKLDELKKSYPDWEPGIVNYRSRYVKDKIAHLKEAGATLPETTAPPSNASTSKPTAPTTQAMPDSSPSLITPPTAVTDPNEVAGLRHRIAQLEQELTSTKTQLAAAYAEIGTLKTRLAAAEKELDSARSTNVEERIAGILQENNNLKTQLNDAQSKIKSLQSGGDPMTLAATRDQLTKVQSQLEALDRENQNFRSSNGALKAQLESAQAKLAEADKQSTSMPNGDDMRRENDVLRGIVTRQLQEQARRDAAKQLAAEELQNLKIKSEVLQKQIDILSSPLVVLSPDELSILKVVQAPLIPSVSEGSAPAPTTTQPAPSSTTGMGANPSSSSPSSSVPSTDSSAPTSVSNGAMDTTSNNAGTSPAPTGNPEITSKAKVPEDMREVANDAAELFKKHKYDEAAQRYNTILQKYPDSLYAWSNLGVVRFEQQRYVDAEKALQEAIKLNPNDGFAHSVLGIVYYQLGRFDESIETLSRAIVLDPLDARSRNYLGIACSQKGWQDAAEKSLRKAVEIDPGYGDAHFNLAVIYATQKPPSIELAKKHYKMAIDLGIPKDDQLENLLK